MYEGESSLARHSKHICEIIIEQLRQAPAGRIVIELQIDFNECGVLSAYACDHDTKEKLALTINLNSLINVQFKRDPHCGVVNIDKRMEGSALTRDRHIANFLDDLDAYLEYLVQAYGDEPAHVHSLVTRKCLLAKRYLSRNRLRITLNECYQLAGELEDMVEQHKPLHVDAAVVTKMKAVSMMAASNDSDRSSVRDHDNEDEDEEEDEDDEDEDEDEEKEERTRGKLRQTRAKHNKNNVLHTSSGEDEDNDEHVYDTADNYRYLHDANDRRQQPRRRRIDTSKRGGQQVQTCCML